MSSQGQTSEFAQSQALQGPQSAACLFDQYRRHPTAWDEIFAGAGRPHEHTAPLLARLGALTTAEFQQLRGNADLVFINQGITFSVYADRRGVEKIFPYDLIPRIVSAHEWETMEAGLLPWVPPLKALPPDASPHPRPPG